MKKVVAKANGTTTFPWIKARAELPKLMKIKGRKPNTATRDLQMGQEILKQVSKIQLPILRCRGLMQEL